MKLISWNVDGLKNLINKDSFLRFRSLDADFFCLQDIQIKQAEIDLEFDGYYSYWNYANKTDDSGTVIYTKEKPLDVTYGIGIDSHDTEGRVITLEYKDYIVVTCYTPSAQSHLKNLTYRMEWENDFQAHIQTLDLTKPVILCGDLNVAHQEIDLMDPENHRRSPGFTNEERAQFKRLLKKGFVDSFRYFYPDQESAYSWWNHCYGARERQDGWRIDYFIVSKRLEDQLVDSNILSDYTGSDHCPVALQIDL
ncbi:exodeoxyribonuclease III [Marinilactibacillus kalidii]|uniref:exodeoxyribonuclease III n=1 Tax=Marinilactibacillus kalidii TaxID=2820274 RepID=UPI001ABE7AC0|nr:exodeoxyribonuclease III [Marinilactibacillus kalidii]